MWTEDMVERLTTDHGAGKSATLIQRRLLEEFGAVKSRNAVIGKIHRLGLVRDASRSPERKEREKLSGLPFNPTNTKPIGGAALAKRVNVLREILAAKEVAVKAPEANPVPGGVALLDLQPHSCRWPLGDPRDENFSFCGAEKEAGCSYCSAHARRAFTGIPKPKVILGKRIAA